MIKDFIGQVYNAYLIYLKVISLFLSCFFIMKKMLMIQIFLREFNLILICLSSGFATMYSTRNSLVDNVIADDHLYSCDYEFLSKHNIR